MLTEFQKNQIAFAHQLNLNCLIFDSIDALEFNAGSMSWSYKFGYMLISKHLNTSNI